MEEKDILRASSEETEDTAKAEVNSEEVDAASAGGEEKAAEASEAEEAKEEASEAEDTPEEKKGFFKKKKDKKDTQIEELTDRVRRQMAEFDNYRKRTEKEKAAMFEVGAKSTLEKILPVVDNFERGLAAAADKEDPFVQGVEKIYKQLMDTLAAMEVKPIEAVGQAFDPDFHNAVMHVEDEEVGENIVVEEFQKGYMYRESVLRHSMVKVAN